MILIGWKRGSNLLEAFLFSLILVAPSNGQELENIVLGRPTNNAIAISVEAGEGTSVIVEYGEQSGIYSSKTDPRVVLDADPVVIELAALRPDTRYFYRLSYRRAGQAEYQEGAEYSFVTQRARNSTFTFGVQGDSHPERLGIMYHPELYRRTLENVASVQPDLYFMLGDDFSTQRLIQAWRQGSKQSLSQTSVDDIYINQRSFLSRMANGTSLFMVNGNHEEAKRHLIGGPLHDAAIFAGRARIRFFPLPAPDGFYSGDAEPLEEIGLLRDYYAFEWGDALFMMIDPYWHSPVPIGNVAGEQAEERDPWDATMGDAQYTWFKRTLEQSDAKYKFVFTHHVLGGGRGGIERAHEFEWGGHGGGGSWEFGERRPTWELPVHQLMVKHGVTIFFQAHDHLFAKQELDGVIYQSVPNPADELYKIYNERAYVTGDILPNSGFLKVTVAPTDVTVEYVRSYLAEHETAERRHGEVAYSYTVE